MLSSVSPKSLSRWRGSIPARAGFCGTIVVILCFRSGCGASAAAKLVVRADHRLPAKQVLRPFRQTTVLPPVFYAPTLAILPYILHRYGTWDGRYRRCNLRNGYRDRFIVTADSIT